jgi:restriction system protein
MVVPQYDKLFDHVLQALKRLGGSASIAELGEEVIKNLNLTPEEIGQPHDERRTVLEYRLAWARTYLKAYGLLDNSARGIWVLTSQGKAVNEVDPLKVVRHVRKQRGNKQPHPEELTALDAPEVAEAVLEQTWKEELLRTLLKLQPDAFERLCQRLLRESGFTQVHVTGRAGDGGIDGVGLVRLGGLLSFPIIFQCKRYQGSIGPSIIRDFRGAMIGRADRGLVITTGTFSQDAKKEATRDGAPPIDLVDGEQLVEKLKELGLGVEVKMIEEVTVVPEWFHAV